MTDRIPIVGDEVRLAHWGPGYWKILRIEENSNPYSGGDSVVIWSTTWDTEMRYSLNSKWIFKNPKRVKKSGFAAFINRLDQSR